MLSLFFSPSSAPPLPRGRHAGTAGGASAVGGVVRIAGAPTTPAQRRALAGYVTPQHDVLPGALTLGAHLMTPR